MNADLNGRKSWNPESVVELECAAAKGDDHDAESKPTRICSTNNDGDVRSFIR
jgi:hypothetical protein